MSEEKQQRVELPLSWKAVLLDEFLDDLEQIPEADQDKLIRYLKDNVPQMPDPRLVGDKKSGDLKGLYSFDKGTSVGRYRIFFTANEYKKVIMVCHLLPRKDRYDKKNKKALKKTLNKYSLDSNE